MRVRTGLSERSYIVTIVSCLYFYGTKSGITLLIFALEQKLKVHWNGLQKTFLLSYYTSKSEQAENSVVLAIIFLSDLKFIKTN